MQIHKQIKLLMKIVTFRPAAAAVMGCCRSYRCTWRTGNCNMSLWSIQAYYYDEDFVHDWKVSGFSSSQVLWEKSFSAESKCAPAAHHWSTSGTLTPLQKGLGTFGFSLRVSWISLSSTCALQFLSFSHLMHLYGEICPPITPNGLNQALMTVLMCYILFPRIKGWCFNW